MPAICTPPLCGIFAPNSGYVARYAPFIRDKSPTNCDAQLPESNLKNALEYLYIFKFQFFRS
ncbi:DUF6783 domain-containing protein [Robinsoniella peoriensis]|uniref:DUF6783 domain-containing protein n=1 Tax=Robinsoniella peoriensis TaxID=180332 RepID=UPI0009DDDA26